MESLEYKGEYGCRYLCGGCKNQKEGICSIINNDKVKVNDTNNVCRWYQPRIKNPSAPEFQFDDYLEFLMSDYYRPYNVDKDIIRGSARLGEVILDDGKMARLLADTYSYFYKYYDQPYCRLVNPLTTVSIGKYAFQIDYRLYREQKWLVDGVITYKQMRWKEKPSARKYKVLHNGTVEIGKLI